MPKRGKKKNMGLQMGSIVGIQGFSIIIVAMFAVLMFIYFYGSDFGFTPTMGATLINLVPPIFLFVAGCWILSDARNPLFIGAGFMVIGIAMAFLFSSLYGQGLLTDAMLAPATLSTVEMWSVIVCTLLGGVCAAALRKH